MNNKIICKLNVKRTMCLLLSILLIFTVVNTTVSAESETYGTLLISTALDGDDAPSGDIIRYHITAKDNADSVIYDIWITQQNESGGSGNLTTSLKVPLNATYSVMQVLPTGYTTSGDASQDVTITDSSTPGSLVFTCNYNSVGYFRTHQEAQNQAVAENIYSVEATAQLNPVEPVDVILLLDYSSSMIEILDEDEGETRFEAMQEAVVEFLKQLSESLNTDTSNTTPSRIGVILFGETVDLLDDKMYNAYEIDDLIAKVNAIEPPPAGNGTPTDLALSKAYETLDDYESLDYSLNRYVLLFTDGLPSDLTPDLDTYGGTFPILYGPEGSYNYTRTALAEYKSNSYRVAAESLNQANVLKGSGTVTTNASFTGTFYPVNKTEDIDLTASLGEITFYGVNSDNSDEWPSIVNDRDSTSNISGIDAVNVTFETAKAAYETGANGGNKDRSAEGMEAIISTIAVIDTDSLSDADQVHTKRLFSEISSDGTTYYVDDMDSLKEAFDEALLLIGGISDAYIAVNLGSEYQPLGGIINISVDGGKSIAKEITVDSTSGEHIVYVYLDKMYYGDDATFIKILVLKKSETALPENPVGIYYPDGTALKNDLIKAVSCKIIA